VRLSIAKQKAKRHAALNFLGSAKAGRRCATPVKTKALLEQALAGVDASIGIIRIIGPWAHGPMGPKGPWALWAHGPMGPPREILIISQEIFNEIQ